MENETIGVQFELPKDVHAKLNAMAREQRRSMSGQAITIIEAAVRDWIEQQDSQRRPAREPQPA